MKSSAWPHVTPVRHKFIMNLRLEGGGESAFPTKRRWPRCVATHTLAAMANASSGGWRASRPFVQPEQEEGGEKPQLSA